MPNRPPLWDIFCRVVDNYGDIGVCWRLARQLAAEHGLRVRLWVDDLASFSRLNPEIRPALAVQASRGVEVRCWRRDLAEIDRRAGVGDVVIEAFACELPQDYVADMAAREPRPVWINLEYLSAENWVRGCHGLPSPHIRLPLTKFFFFPGFFAGTGGLLLERDLIEERRQFQQDARARAQFWGSLGLSSPGNEQVCVSLFSYENAGIAELLDAWAGCGMSVRCLAPAGPSLAQVGAYFGQTNAAAGAVFRRQGLEVCILPFLEQDRYDRLLWACDCNFVRGEDSFVRAQWAAQLLVWHIYPQQEGAHWSKLAAFVDLYCEGLAAAPAAALGALWQAWNRGQGAGAAWTEFWRHRAALRARAEQWSERLARRGDCAAALVKFCKDRLQ